MKQLFGRLCLIAALGALGPARAEAAPAAPATALSGPAASASQPSGHGEPRPAVGTAIAGKPAGRAAQSAPASLPAVLALDGGADVLAQSVLLLTGNNELGARRIGARALLASGDPEAQKRVMDVLLARPEDPAAQTAVCQELAARPSPSAAWIDPMIQLAASSREELARSAATALLRFAPQDVIPRLKSAAARANGDAGARRAAVAALGCMGASPAVVGALVDMLDDPDAETREAVLDAIERVTGLGHGGPDDVRAWWLANRDKPAEQWQAELQMSRDRSLREMESRLHDLARRLCERFKTEYLQSPDAQKPQRLIALLGDPEPAVRQLGLELTDALITDRKPVPAEVAQQVRIVLADPQAELRRRSALILGSIRDAADAPTLRAALQREPAVRVRAALTRALARASDAAALEDLQALLADPCEDVAIEAAIGVGVICERLPADSAARGRASAAIAQAFAEIEHPSAALTVAFLDAMRMVGDARFREEFASRLAATQPAEVRQAAIRGAAAVGDAALIERITGLLSDSEPTVRLAAARELGRCPLTDAQLERLLARLTDGAERVEQARAEAWDSFVRSLQNRPLADRARWAQRVAADPSGAPAAKVLEFLSQLDRQCADDADAARLRPGVRQLLARRLFGDGRYADAAAIYDELLADPSADRGPLGEQAVRAALRAGRPDSAVALVRRSYASPAAASAPSNDLLTACIDEAGRMATDKQASAAAEALSRLQTELSDLIAPAQQAALAAATAEIDQARLAAAARKVEASIAALRGGGPEWRRAHEQLVANGRGSLPALAAALAAPTATSGPATEGEQRLVACIREIEPDWRGFAPDADSAARNAAVSDLRQRLAAAGGRGDSNSSGVRTP